MERELEGGEREGSYVLGELNHHYYYYFKLYFYFWLFVYLRKTGRGENEKPWLCIFVLERKVRNLRKRERIRVCS